jgi:hypothetical protein
MPRRVILLDAGVLADRGEFERILTHEIFHFAWLRLSNGTRRSWERVVEKQLAAAGELGWSAERRKSKLARGDAAHRTPAWRRYACESFCDTAAWLYSGLRGHPEFTLAARSRPVRRSWFEKTLGSGPLKV